MTNIYYVCNYVLRCKFPDLVFIVHSQNTHMSPHIILNHINIPIYIYILIYYPNIPSQILHTQAHKLSCALSQILSIISHILSNLNSPQIILIILLPKLSCKIILSPRKAQHHLACGQNPKKAQTP